MKINCDDYTKVFFQNITKGSFIFCTRPLYFVKFDTNLFIAKKARGRVAVT